MFTMLHRGHIFFHNKLDLKRKYNCLRGQADEQSVLFYNDSFYSCSFCTSSARFERFGLVENVFQVSEDCVVMLSHAMPCVSWFFRLGVQEEPEKQNHFQPRAVRRVNNTLPIAQACAQVLQSTISYATGYRTWRK